MVKNKIEFAHSTSNCLVTHKNLGNCKKLSDEVFTKQITGLIYRLNSTGIKANVAKKCITQGWFLAALSERSPKESDIVTLKKL